MLAVDDSPTQDSQGGADEAHRRLLVMLEKGIGHVCLVFIIPQSGRLQDHHGNVFGSHSAIEVETGDNLWQEVRFDWDATLHDVGQVVGVLVFGKATAEEALVAHTTHMQVKYSIHLPGKKKGFRTANFVKSYSPDFGQNLTEPISANNNTIGKGIPRGAE